MEKERTKRKERPLIRQFWAERGFNREIANSEPDPNEDPTGEEAYQRAFYDAEKANPPRVPNPAQFPNSDSAKAYMARHTAGLAQSMQERRHDRPDDGELAYRQRRARGQSPTDILNTSSSTSPVSSYNTNMFPPLNSTRSTPRTIEGLRPEFRINPISPSRDRPSIIPPLEPFGAPRGPANPFAYGR